jgi:hypothetical protein
MADFKIPEGWTMEPSQFAGNFYINRPDAGTATVDFEKRVYRWGANTVGAGRGSADVPMGRGWKQKLVDEAVAWLASV